MTPAQETQPLARWRVIDTLFLASVRADMRTELERHGYDESAIDSVALVMTELAGNAFQHGATPVEIGLDAGPQELIVRVTDTGEGFDDQIAALLVADQQGVLRLGTSDTELVDVADLPENGRGLQIVSAVADVRVTQRMVQGRSLTTVRATVAVQRPEITDVDIDPLAAPVSAANDAIDAD